MIALASQYGRYGYRRITTLLQRIGWRVGRDRVQRIWRREGLKVPMTLIDEYTRECRALKVARRINSFSRRWINLH
jgi:hypothetical protein